MAHIVQVSLAGELQSGAMKMVEIEGHQVLLARVQDAYYAVDSRCPHMGGNLSQGTLQGTIVTCPRHHSQFDITDGHVVRWTDYTGVMLGVAKIFRSPRPIKTYKVSLDEERIMIDLEEPVAAAA